MYSPDRLLEHLQQWFNQPVSLEMVSVNLLDLREDIAELFGDFESLEAIAMLEGSSIEEVEANRVASLPTEDEKYISALATAVWNAVREVQPQAEDMSWYEFAGVLRTAPGPLALLRKNQRYAKQASDLLSKAFATALVIESDDVDAEMPTDDDPRIVELTQWFSQGFRLLLESPSGEEIEEV